MPYCTIEEAWSQSLNPELNEHQINANNMDNNNYLDVEYKQSQLYDSSGEKIPSDFSLKKKKKRHPNYSRTYNRLSEHSGINTRLNDKNNKRLIIDKETKSLDSSNKFPNYSNSDLPINKYDNEMYQKLDDEYRKHNSKIEESSMMEDFKNLDTLSYQSGNLKINNQLLELKKENFQLKKIIQELKNNKLDDNDSKLDIIVYIFSGVMIILMMENITKLFRRV